MKFELAPAIDFPTESAAWQRAYRGRRGQVARAVGRQPRTRAANVVVGVDGEGLTRNDGGHDYVLLAASDGSAVSDDAGLSTEACLRFLLDLRGKLVVGFAFSYDTNKLLTDLRPRQLLRLHKTGRLLWRGPSGVWYRVGYTPRKALVVSELDERSKSIRTVTVWDTFGFYQTGFVAALRAWKIGTDAELAQLDSMKGKRSDFANVAPESVTAYNDLECRLLVDLTTALRATVERTGYKLARWDGAGALASAILRRHNVKTHLSGDYPDQVRNAYFGGRIQVCQLGEIDGPVFNYDINSAYPAVIAGLPSLAGGKWEWTDAYDGSQWALWRCRWHLQDRALREFPNGKSVWVSHGRVNTPVLTPFPFRDKQCNIHYPLCGEGWYWSPLVDLAVKNWKVEVLGGWRFVPATTERPFGFVRELFDKRQVYKRQADPRHIVLKLGLNAMYGKFAQGVGWRDSIPPYRNYVYAGLITATAQAWLLEAALSEPASLISFATDGIYSRKPLAVNIGSGLGEWEASEYEGMTVFQPGLYIVQKDGKPVYRTRGYHPDEINWNEMRRMWQQLQWFASYDFTVSRFVPMGIALQTKQLRNWGRWADSPRQVSLRPATGFPGEKISDTCTRWEPDYIVKGCEISQPFSPKRSKYEIEQDIRRSWDEEQRDPLAH